MFGFNCVLKGTYVYNRINDLRPMHTLIVHINCCKDVLFVLIDHLYLLERYCPEIEVFYQIFLYFFWQLIILFISNCWFGMPTYHIIHLSLSKRTFTLYRLH